MMASKVLYFTLLVACCHAACSQESAASPGQIAYAISQNYDDTGSGSNSVQQATSSPQSSSNSQYSSSFYNQQYQQPQLYAQQYSQPQSNSLNQQNYQQVFQYSQPIAAYAPQALNYPQYSQSQLYSNLGRIQSSNQISHPQVVYQPLQTAQVYQAQPSQVTYATQPHVYTQNQPITYSHQPSIIKASPVKSQPEYYDNSNIQYAYEEVQPSDSKYIQEAKQEESHASFPYVIPEHYSQPQNNFVVQKPSLKSQEHSFVPHIQKPTQALPISKPVYSSTVAKPVFAAPLAKFSQPIQAQYTYSH